MQKGIDRNNYSSGQFQSQPYWRHPGGKLREMGADKLTDNELLAIIISSGIKGKSAEKIASEILDKYGSLEGLASQPLEALLKIKGLGDRKIIRIAAAYELARRLMDKGGSYDVKRK